MQALQGWFGGRSADAEPPASVLAEWNKYSTEPSQPSQTDRLLASAEAGASSVGKAIGSTFASVSTGVSGAATSMSTGLQSMPSGTQLVYFAAVAGAGAFLLLVAFFLFLPMIIIAPSKFAITFSLGSALILASVGALRGWRAQGEHMLSRERLPFTAGYIGSLAGTIYAAVIMHSYVFSLLFCAVQVAALLYYVLSYFPGGSSGAQFMLGMLGRGFGQACGACTKVFFK